MYLASAFAKTGLAHSGVADSFPDVTAIDIRRRKHREINVNVAEQHVSAALCRRTLH